MPVLGNSRHETVARLLAAGCSAGDASAQAGYDIKASSFESNARKRAQREDIQARRRELQREISDKFVEVTAQWIEERLIKIADIPVTDAKASDVISALRELGKFKGYYAPDKIAPTNPGGDAPYDAGLMNDEQRAIALEAFVAKHKGKA